MDRYLSIQAFVKVAEKESFAEAARQLGVARSVVTERIKQLERFVEAPLLHRSLPEALNVCVTDNDPLARYLVSDFAAHFGAFKNAAALQYMDYVPLEGVTASGDTRSTYMEWFKGPGVEATLSWEELGEPFMISLPKEKSATGKHALHSLFVDARRVTTTVNGRSLKGQPVPREFAGRQSSTAFLAYSETWIKV